MKVIRHLLIVCAALLLIIGIPFFRSGYFAAMISGEDAVASATVALDQPSGEYVVMINETIRTDDETLNTWTDYFSGKEIDFLFEDIRCCVASGDAPGLEMARSYQSRLPENQMKIRTEDATLMLSKAEYGNFDIIVMSKEFADIFGADSLKGQEGVRYLEVKGAQ